MPGRPKRQPLISSAERLQSNEARDDSLDSQDASDNESETGPKNQMDRVTSNLQKLLAKRVRLSENQPGKLL